jgi:hypothetical protein
MFNTCLLSSGSAIMLVHTHILILLATNSLQRLLVKLNFNLALSDEKYHFFP